MTDRNDHYEALFDSQYLRWFDLVDRQVLIRITKVERRELTLRGGVKKNSGVVSFEVVQGELESVKPLVLNRTNGDAIAGIHGVSVVDWVGKEIVLYVTQTKLKGKPVNCIRVRAKKQTN